MHRYLFADRRHITQKSNDLRTRIGVLEGQIDAERTALRLLSGREREDKQFYIRNLRKTVKDLRRQLNAAMEEQPGTPTQKRAAQTVKAARAGREDAPEVVRRAFMQRALKSSGAIHTKRRG